MSSYKHLLTIDTHCSKEVHKIVQPALFALGYTWGYNTTEVQYTGERYLYVDDDMSLGYGEDIYVNGYMADDYEHIDAADYLNIEL